MKFIDCHALTLSRLAMTAICHFEPFYKKGEKSLFLNFEIFRLFQSLNMTKIQAFALNFNFLLRKKYPHPNPLRKGGGFITHCVRCGYFAFAQYDKSIFFKNSTLFYTRTKVKYHKTKFSKIKPSKTKF